MNEHRMLSLLARTERTGRAASMRRRAKGLYQNLLNHNNNSGHKYAHLTKSEQRFIKRYCRRRFGSSLFAPWLYFYASFRGEFMEGWLPNDLFCLYILPVVNKKYREIAAAKTMTRQIFATDHIPDIAYRINGMWFDSSLRPLPAENIRSTLYRSNAEIVLKADSSNRGRGIWIVTLEEFDAFPFDQYGDIVVQTLIQQADWFEQVSPRCLATLRITSAFSRDRGPHMRAAYLRVGTGGSRYIGPSFIRWAVLDEGGTMKSHAAHEDWRWTDRHPDTGFVFDNTLLPGFADALHLCLELHARVPQFTVIGWDVAVGQGGHPHLIEWNAIHPGIVFSEASTGPIFAGMEQYLIDAALR